MKLYLIPREEIKMSITEIVENITPKQAERYLELNIDGERVNRKLKPFHVIKLANEMQKGHWDTDVNPIIFDEKGRLIDGQHRLHAIIYNNEPQPMLVRRGVNSEAFKVLDQNYTRDAVAFAVIERRYNPHEAVPVFRWLYNYKVTGVPTVVPSEENRLSEYDLQKWGYENHPGVREAIQWVKENHGREIKIPDRVMRYCAYQMFKIDREQAKHYLSYLTVLDGVTEYLTFKKVKTLINSRLDSFLQNKMYSRDLNEHIMTYIIAGWNKVREGKTNLSKFSIEPKPEKGAYDIN